MPGCLSSSTNGPNLSFLKRTPNLAAKFAYLFPSRAPDILSHHGPNADPGSHESGREPHNIQAQGLSMPSTANTPPRLINEHAHIQNGGNLHMEIPNQVCMPMVSVGFSVSFPQDADSSGPAAPRLVPEDIT